ncbi:hypothetical protein ES703_115928 [subsurface metagenome]
MKLAAAEESCKLNAGDNLNACFFAELQSLRISGNCIMIGNRNSFQVILSCELDNMKRRKAAVATFIGMNMQIDLPLHYSSFFPVKRL